MADSDSEIRCQNCKEAVKDAAAHVTRDVGPFSHYYFDCKKPKKCSNCGWEKAARSMIMVTDTRTFCCTAMCLNELVLKIKAYKDEHFTPKPRVDSSTSDDDEDATDD